MSCLKISWEMEKTVDRQRNDFYFNIFLNLIRASYMRLEKGWQEEAQVSGISYAQQHALWLLHVQDGLTLEELGDIAVWNKSTTSAMVTRLEKKGFVRKVKEQEGSRTLRIYLTEEGWRKIEESINTEECLSYMSLFRNTDEETLKRFLLDLEEVFDRIDQGKSQNFKRFIDVYSKNLLK